jgi:hypothetical protein
MKTTLNILCAAALVFCGTLAGASPARFYETKGMAFAYSLEVVETSPHISKVFEAGSDYLFRPGERFHIRISGNTDGYLYLFRRTHDGKLVPFEPTADNGGVPVVHFAEYVFPREAYFQSDEGPDPDEIWILYSRTQLMPVRLAEDNLKSFFLGQDNPASDISLVKASKEDGLVTVDPAVSREAIAYRLILRRR